MKRLILLFSFCLLAGCDVLGDKSGDLVIHLQSSFEGEEVRILVGNQEVYRDRPQTNYVLGFADGTQVSLDQGWHAVRVEVAGETPVHRVIKLKEKGHLGVTYQCSQIASPCERDTVKLSFQETGWVYF